MRRCDSHFMPLLDNYNVDALESHPSTVYGIWPDSSLAYFNIGWLRFAAENGGEPAISKQWGIGRRIDEAFADPVRDFYWRKFHDCLEESQPWNHEYECSSDSVYRKYHMIAYPLCGEGILIVNSLLIEKPHDKATRPTYPPLEHAYVDSAGIMHQCCHCRRFHRPGVSGQWDWVPAWVAQTPANTSHGICPLCLKFYYPGAAAYS